MNDSTASDLHTRFATALHTSARAWRVALDARLKDLGISQAGWMTIAMVAKSDTDLSQKQLADLLGVEGPTIVAMVDRLVGAGLVRRAPSPLDRRVKLIVLTEAGTAVYAKVMQRADVFRAGLLSDVDAQALASATVLLESLQARIEELR